MYNRHRGEWVDNIMKCIFNKQGAIVIEFNWLRTADFLKRCNLFPDSAGDEEFLGNLSGYWLVKNVDAWRWL